MRNLTLGDLDIGLRDLVTERKVHLEASGVGKVYAPQIIAQQQAIDALPEPEKGRVNADALAETDAAHDGFGNGIHCYTEAILAVPDLSDVTRATARRVREAFVPTRSVLADSFADEAKRAKDNRPKLADLEADLKSLPIPEGKSLYDWALSFVDAGDQLSRLLSDRASTEAQTANGQLRRTTLRLLYRFRKALRDELSWNQSLPQDLESRVFSYLDELSARRPKSKAAKESGDQDAPPAESDAPPDGGIES